MNDDAPTARTGASEHPPDLIEQLASLFVNITNADATRRYAEPLAATLDEAISGYAGMRLTLVHTGHPVHLTAVAQHIDDLNGVVTSLRLPLPLLSPTFEAGGRLVVWSTVSGSMVDLAADLTHVFDVIPAVAPDTGDIERDAGSRDAVELDIDLPAAPATTGVEGLDELAEIHRAAGLLIADRVDPDTALAALRTTRPSPE